MKLKTFLMLSSMLPMISTGSTSQEKRKTVIFTPTKTEIMLLKEEYPFLSFIEINDKVNKAHAISPYEEFKPDFSKQVGRITFENGVAKIPYRYWAFSNDLKESKLVGGFCHGQLRNIESQNAEFVFSSIASKEEVFPGVKKLQCLTVFYDQSKTYTSKHLPENRRWTSDYFNEEGLPVNRFGDHTPVREYRFSAVLEKDTMNTVESIEITKVLGHRDYRDMTPRPPITDQQILNSERIDLGTVSLIIEVNFDLIVEGRIKYKNSPEPEDFTCTPDRSRPIGREALKLSFGKNQCTILSR